MWLDPSSNTHCVSRQDPLRNAATAEEIRPLKHRSSYLPSCLALRRKESRAFLQHRYPHMTKSSLSFQKGVQLRLPAIFPHLAVQSLCVGGAVLADLTLPRSYDQFNGQCIAAAELRGCGDDAKPTNWTDS